MLHREVSVFLSHKLHLAKTSSFYQHPEARQSIQWAYSFREYLKYKASQLSEREIAFELFQYRKHLETLLPCDKNKSYESSKKKFEYLITRCKELLQPKKQ